MGVSQPGSFCLQVDVNGVMSHAQFSVQTELDFIEKGNLKYPTWCQSAREKANCGREMVPKKQTQKAQPRDTKNCTTSYHFH